jgi:hypothetical protein
VKTPVFRRLSLALIISSITALAASRGEAQIIALDSPAPLFGNQDFGGSLGMEFNVGLNAIQITRVGAFDSGQDGFFNNINVRIYDRDNTAIPVVAETLGAGLTGTLINGSRFVPPTTTLTLAAGFRGAIVADGYSGLEPLNNTGVAGAPLSTINTGGGLLRFVGQGRFDGAAGVYPANVDGGPANRYHAGTFEYQVVGPQFHMAYDVTPGLAGGQNYNGSLGLDFDVGLDPISVTHLGVFDSVGDGLALTITAYIYDRDTQSPIFGPLSFSGNGDLLVNGSRWKDVGDFTLPAGFHGSVVAEGYGLEELLYNMGGNPNAAVSSLLDDAGGAISFVGSGRFGNAGSFPGNGDGGPVNRYAAGTFAYVVVPEPSAVLSFLAGGAILVARRRRTAGRR